MQLRHRPPALVHRIGTAVPAQPGLSEGELDLATHKALEDARIASLPPCSA